jgi:hypothetical protein
MPDLVFVVVSVAFFALCVGYVWALDRLVRAAGEAPPGESGSTGTPGASTSGRVAGTEGGPSTGSAG